MDRRGRRIGAVRPPAPVGLGARRAAVLVRGDAVRAPLALDVLWDGLNPPGAYRPVHLKLAGVSASMRIVGRRDPSAPNRIKRSRGPCRRLSTGPPEALAGGRWLGGGLLSVPNGGR